MPGGSANTDLIAALKEEDARIASGIRYLVGVPHEVKKDATGKDIATWGPIAYPHTRDPPMIDKMNFGKILTGARPTPTVTITEEDIAIEKEKAWVGELKNFNDWVGTVFKPEDSPANKELLSRVYPEWIQMQKDEIDNWHDMKKRIETIKLKGADNKEDLFLLYRLGWPELGAMSDPILIKQMQDSMAPGLAGKDAGWRAGSNPTENYQRGLFATRRRMLDTMALAKGPMGYNDGYSDATAKANSGTGTLGMGMAQHLRVPTFAGGYL